MTKLILLGLLSLVSVIAIGFGIAMATGYLGIAYTETVGVAQKDADRHVFERSQSFVHGKTQELAKVKREWDQTEDMTERQVLEEHIRMQFANVHADDMPNGLGRFLTNIRGY